MQSYWNKVLDRRITRRRAIAATGMTAGAAAFLAACGGGDDDDEPEDAASRDTSGLLNSITEEKGAKRGGIFTVNNGSNRDPLHLDGKAQGQVQLNFFQSMTYEALVANKPGFKEPSTWSEVNPNLAESWEVSGDGLQITFKLRQDVKWHNKAPVNGRGFDAEDVIATWNSFISAETPNNKASSANSLNPNAPIVGWEAPDPYTLVLNLARPTSMIYQRLASMITGEVGSIYPREYGDTFQAETDQIGTGGWVLDRFEPSVGLYYKRNPEYWNDKAAWYDEVHVPLIPEYAQQLAQLRTGALSQVIVRVLAEDIIPTKKEKPDLQMVAGVGASNSPGATMRFGWDNIAGKPSPFLDERVRQALSMSFDRDAYIDAFYNVSKFEGEGLPVDTYWYTQHGYVPGWTLDPRNAEEFGDGARLYEHNVAEAMKLKAAAESDYEGGKFPSFVTGRVNAVFGPIYTSQVEVMDQFAREIGFDIEAFPLDYNLDYLPKVVTKQGHFEVPDMGWAYAIGAVTSPDPTDLWVWRFYSKGGVTSGSIGLGTDGGPAADADIDRLTEAAIAEF
ncbi:MAG TPA: ABC transporter substrate-binding protein, partial [Dehalococcoidia bacterium]|nr:ABC transporter substrate-binding protein [Dehalococcoidia bacterium]